MCCEIDVRSLILHVNLVCIGGCKVHYLLLVVSFNVTAKIGGRWVMTTSSSSLPNLSEEDAFSCAIIVRVSWS